MPWLLFAIAILWAALHPSAFAQLPNPGSINAPADARYCGDPARDATGRIMRRYDSKKTFAAVWPCPSTGLRVPACPGWQIDHVIPLAQGGCDLAFNMQWMPTPIKTAPGRYPKDRWERCVYSASRDCLYGR